MTAPAIQTSPALESEPPGEAPPSLGLAFRIRDIFEAAAHGSRSAPVLHPGACDDRGSLTEAFRRAIAPRATVSHTDRKGPA